MRKVVILATYENLIAYYNALRCIWEKEYDIFMNTTLWNDIIKPLTKREHSQFGIVAISRAAMVDVNKETWKAYLERRDKIIHIDECRIKNREDQLQHSLLKKQASALDQMKEVITEEWAEKWAKAGITEEDLKQFALMKGIVPNDQVTSGPQKGKNVEAGKRAATEDRRPPNKKKQKSNEVNQNSNANGRQAKNKQRSFNSPNSFNSQKDFNTPRQSKQQQKPFSAKSGGKPAFQPGAKFNENRNRKEFFANKPQYRRGKLISALHQEEILTPILWSLRQ